MRPSDPVRHLILSRNARRCSNARRVALGLLLRGMATLRTPSWWRSSSTDASPQPPISGHCPWWASGAAADPFDGGCQLRCICGVSELDAVVQDDTVGVVDDLGLVAELDRLAQSSLADRASVGIVETDQAAA